MFRVVAALLLCLLSSVLIVTSGTVSAKSSVPDMSRDELLRLCPDDFYMGNPKAPVTVIEYHSMTCPHCAYFDDKVLPKIKDDFVNNNKVLYIVREHPVDRQSFDAALMMRCMPSSKVAAFRSVLFSQQREWWGKENYLTSFKRYASLGGIDERQMAPCMADESVKDAIFKSKLAAIRVAGVRNVPTFFVNGKRHEGARPWEYWKSLLDEAVADAESARVVGAAAREVCVPEVTAVGAKAATTTGDKVVGS